jgi:thiol-disulfide isomerase/thioredoxin
MITEITMQEMTEGLPTPDNYMRVVMFFGETCGPCKATMPNYELASNFYEERNALVKCFRLNAWQPEEQKKYCDEVWKITGVPTFKTFYKGNLILEKVGGGDEEAMRQFIHEGIDQVFKQFGEKI